MSYNDFFITAMDRFVWFILLVVLSHLVTEFTSGYTRGDRTNLIPINESFFLNAIEVPSLKQFHNHNLDLMKEQSNEAASSNVEEKTFSLRPLIDSIFEIPLSALSAVNRLVQRLTGSYYVVSTSSYPEKSVLKKESA